MRYSAILFTFLVGISVIGQQTGSFSLLIEFDEPDYSMSNELAFFVPTDYDSQNVYPLIVGFRGGPHSGPGNLRDQLEPLSDSLGAIIMCPESVGLWQGGQENLVKALFQHAVDTTASLYSIDMNMIYVTGLSFGGRHTVLVGMDTDTGPIYPGLRGMIPFAAGTNSENVANYGVDTEAPICTCIGSNDASFFNISNSLHENATAAGHSSFFNEIPGVGHTMAFPSLIDEMMECFDFIESQYATNLIEYDNFEIEAFPNPVIDILSFRFPAGIFPRIEIYDITGRMVLTATGFMPSGPGASIDMSGLDKGTYLITVMQNELGSSNSAQPGSPERSSLWVVKD